MATKHVLCRYYLHGACRNGADCPFSHSLQDSESQVCRYYLKGECAYGERCRYLHAKPDWAAARHGGADSSHAAAPTVRRPAVDDLAEQLPISQLRLGGAAAAAAGGQGGGAGSPAGATAGATGSSRPGGFGSGSSLGRPATAQTADGLLLPLPLPADPFGAAQGGDGDVAAGDDSEWQEGGEAQWGEEEEEYWEHGGDEGEGEWGEYYDEDGGEEGHWGEPEGGGDEWQEGEAHSGWQQGQQEQHAALQPPAPGAGSGQQQRQQAWAIPAELTEQQQWAATAPPSLRSLCQQFFRSGSCQQGASCKLVHGELCPHCHKYALHPADSAAREQHLAECRLRHERLAARARSAGVECGICLEPVLSKATPGDRRFGLLTGCDHPFCLRCIRSWRQKTDAGADIDTALRTCPVCRTTSHYIVPSMVWPADHEEKERILAGKQAPPNPRMKIWHSLGHESPLAAYQGGRASSPYLPWPAALYERGWLPGYQRLLSNSCMPFSALPAAGYKAKLGSIDCMHFNYGEGQCPFGTSCFYRHAYPDGRLEEPSLRRIVDEEGVRVVQPVRLSDFIAISAAGARLMGGRRR